MSRGNRQLDLAQVLCFEDPTFQGHFAFHRSFFPVLLKKKDLTVQPIIYRQVQVIQTPKLYKGTVSFSRSEKHGLLFCKLWVWRLNDVCIKSIYQGSAITISFIKWKVAVFCHSSRWVPRVAKKGANNECRRVGGGWARVGWQPFLATSGTHK